MKSTLSVALTLLIASFSGYASAQEDGQALASESDAEALCAAHAKEDGVAASELESYMTDCMASLEAEEPATKEGDE